MPKVCSQDSFEKTYFLGLLKGLLLIYVFYCSTTQNKHNTYGCKLYTQWTSTIYRVLKMLLITQFTHRYPGLRVIYTVIQSLLILNMQICFCKGKHMPAMYEARQITCLSMNCQSTHKWTTREGHNTSGYATVLFPSLDTSQLFRIA